MAKHNTRIIALNVLIVPWHLYRPIDFIVQISYESIYKEYGAIIDGMCEHWQHITVIILDWTSVETIKNSLHLFFFFNNFYLVPMENESLVRHIFKWNVKSHQNVHRVPQSWDVTYDRGFSIWINLQVLLWSTTYQLSTSQLDRSDKWWAIMGVTQ